tara:strand:- start:118 stop:561 length:444 start_codon:yes stop_codon:yes gene_type:complete
MFSITRKIPSSNLGEGIFIFWKGLYTVFKCQIYDFAIESAEINDHLVRRLAEIAEEEGLDRAILDETKNAVTREIFPTQEEYLEFEQRREEISEIFLGQLDQLGGEAEQPYRRVYGMGGRLLSRTIKMFRDSSPEKRVKEIYGGETP